MTTTLAATCQSGVVKVEGVEVPNVHILSEGVGASIGTLFIHEGEAYYVAKISPDLNTTLEKIITALGKTKDALDAASSALTAIDTAGYILTVIPGTGGASGIPATPVASGDISSLDSAAADIDSAKSELQTLKNSLR